MRVIRAKVYKCIYLDRDLTPDLDRSGLIVVLGHLPTSEHMKES